MSRFDLEFYFDPVCPFCWVTSRWVCNVARQRTLAVDWRPLSLRLLNESVGYEDKPAAYPDAHQAVWRCCGSSPRRGTPTTARPSVTCTPRWGEAVWHEPAPAEPTFEAVLDETARARDLAAIVSAAGMPEGLARAAGDAGRDAALREETQQAVDRTGGGVGTPILSFSPPDGPAFFGPVIDTPPDGPDALRLWDAVTTLARWPSFAELKRSARSFPDTPKSAHLAGEATQAR